MIILLVDDEIFSLEMMSRKLSGKGYTVLKATSVLAAQALCADHNDISVVIADIQMPDGSGIDLLVWIREKLPSARRFILSAHTYDKALAEHREGGLVAQIFTKPVDVDNALVPAIEALN